MIRLITLLLVLVSVASAETWTFPNNTKNAILQVENEIQVCSGTGDIVLATGCTGGGTQYTMRLDASTGGLTLPRLLVEPGSFSDPAIAFNGDENTGIDRTLADRLSLVAGGFPTVHVNTSGMSVNTGVITNQDGTSASPSYSFETDSNSGMYSVSADVVGFARGGTAVMQLNSTGLVMESGNVILNRPGTAANPSYSFGTDENTGLFAIGGDNLGVAVGGSTALQLVDNGGNLQANIPSGSPSVPGVAFIADPDTGIYRVGANTMALTTNGTAVLEIQDDNDIRMVTPNSAIIMRSADGTYWECRVANITGVFSCT